MWNTMTLREKRNAPQKGIFLREDFEKLCKRQVQNRFPSELMRTRNMSSLPSLIDPSMEPVV